MESSHALLNPGINNEGLGFKRSISDEKLELRLGPPPSTQVQDTSTHFSSVCGVQGQKVVMKNGLMFQHPSNPTPPCSQKRVAPPSVIGWPPVRSFRKKIGASNSALKPPLDPQSKDQDKGELKIMVKDTSLESKEQNMFVKINMDGVPIGRKVNLRKYYNYESLSSSVDQLFRGLLAAQEGSSWAATEQEDRKEITGLLDGSGEYTLVYEDHEGDRVLVGDVPWNMFLSTVKRLRVLKSSELGAKNG